MAPLVRRQPWHQKLAAYLNPYDFLLYLSEEIESSDWDQLDGGWAISVGVVLNLVFLIARANTTSTTRRYNDVFTDAPGYGWVAYLATGIVYILGFMSLANTLYTFIRKKHYRLFESSIDSVPSTPSARRVRINSSPVALSPLRYLSNIIASDSPDSRAHPDAARDVWQLAVWDPLPISLRLFCYFNPGHIVIYCMFLPTTFADSTPSLKIAAAIVLAFLLSLQLSLLQSRFSQQSKDSAYISKEVLHEYDTKYVRPRTQPLYRDVGTQFTEQASYTPARDQRYNQVDTYTPMVVINRGFKTNPNPSYSPHTDPDGVNNNALRRRQTTAFVTPAQGRPAPSPARPLTAIKQPNFRPTLQGGDGGSLGVYSHAASPLRKSASTNFASRNHIDDYGRTRGSHSPEKRPSSPDKRLSMPATGLAAQRLKDLRGDHHRRESGRF